MLELGKRKTLHGRQAIVDFYREVKSKIRETLVIRTVVAGRGRTGRGNCD